MAPRSTARMRNVFESCTSGGTYVLPMTSGPCPSCGVDEDAFDGALDFDDDVALLPNLGGVPISVPGILRDEPICGPSSTSSVCSGTRF